jgi:hypothetical protein
MGELKKSYIKDPSHPPGATRLIDGPSFSQGVWFPPVHGVLTIFLYLAHHDRSTDVADASLNYYLPEMLQLLYKPSRRPNHSPKFLNSSPTSLVPK